ncbi:MAG: hypothetical protein ACOC16_00250 [Nanoarchaeota archaeon]
MEMIVVKSKIKEVVKDVNVSGDFTAELNEAAVALVEKASKRAESNNRKTIQGKDVFIGKTNSKVMLIVKSKVKDIVSGMNISGDFASHLNEVLIDMIKQAEKRAQANNRKTISARDL